MTRPTGTLDCSHDEQIRTLAANGVSRNAIAQKLRIDKRKVRRVLGHATKGHWPKGKRRHDAATRVLARLRSLLKRSHTGSRPGDAEKISVTAISQHIGVNARTLGRWLSGEDHPSADHAKHLADYLASH